MNPSPSSSIHSIIAAPGVAGLAAVDDGPALITSASVIALTELGMPVGPLTVLTLSPSTVARPTKRAPRSVWASCTQVCRAARSADWLDSPAIHPAAVDRDSPASAAAM